MSVIKKTIDVLLEHEPKLNLLMLKIDFHEVERVSTGGMQSAPSLLITYEGFSDRFHNKGYIVEKAKTDWNNDRYFTIKEPNGDSFKTFDDFYKSIQNIDTLDYKEVD